MIFSVTNVLIAVFAITLTRAAMYGYWLLRTRKLHAEHKQYLLRVLGDEKDEKQRAFSFVERVPEVRELFERAQIRELSNTRMEFVGYGRVQQQDYKGFDNITVVDKQITSWVHESFHEAAGYYKKGLSEAFNPVFWIEFAACAPAALAVQLGAGEGSRWVKAANVIVWLPALLILGYSLGYWGAYSI